MFENDPTELALAGDRGIDLFRRIEDTGQRRVQFECIATVHDAPGGDRRLEVFLPKACPDPERLWQAVARFEQTPALHHDFRFARPGDYPSMRDPASRLLLFQCLEFCRVRMVADLTIASYEERLAEDAERAVRHYGDTTGALKLLLDYNMLARARSLCETLAPRVIARVDTPGFSEDNDEATGFALRLLGDLFLRDQAPDRALACFEAAIRAGDNPFRRRKAIAAAQAAGETGVALAHIDAFAARGSIPADLDALRQSLAGSGPA
ncbi:MAG: hypothetical protein HLUCCA12_01140 [Rhodobacteraceae bacterium HLUCCA12]|nr:MAG: hypothetical protein HLUCCA12_01140 [Rhodobacteraceae bacterium HLUCCA12]